MMMMMMKLAPLLLLLASCLVATGSAAKLNGMVASERRKQQQHHFKRAGESQATLAGLLNCDPLLANPNLAASCQCKEPELAPDEMLEPTTSGQSLNHIDQLTCAPDNQNMSQLLEELSGQLSNATLRIDHLTISANLTGEIPELKSIPRPALIDAITLQLAANWSSDGGHDVQAQLMSLHQVIDFPRLRILFIFLELTGKEQKTSDCQLDLSEFMVPLVSLEKFELNLVLSSKTRSKQSIDCFKLNQQTFRQQQKLKWLNLAHSRLRLDSNVNDTSPFKSNQHLEYLNLEGNSIRKFPIFSLLAGNQQQQKTSSSSIQGLGSLSSLSLANNRLSSFEADIFTNSMAGSSSSSILSRVCFGLDGTNKRVNSFKLMAMNQLDLSRNLLSDMTFPVSQMILCTMPNLTQLYLRNNRLIHLNLNAILQFPVSHLPGSMFSSDAEPEVGRKTLTLSQLEILDLSHNQLSHVTVFQDPRSTLKSQLKSLNLDNNKLHEPATIIDIQLVNKILFQETFNGHHELVQLGHLDSILSLASVGSNLTICDLLSSNEQLNELSVSSNHLTRLAGETFGVKSCRDIQVLKLNKNRIQSIESGAFLGFSNLEQLTLANNLISELPDQIFSKNFKLRLLDLSGNRLSSLDRKLLWRLQKLENLQLANNQLFELNGDFLAQNQRLEILDLSFNKLTHLDETLLQNLKLLKLINLHNNKLKFLDQSTFSRSNHQLEYVDLHSNQLSRIQIGTFAGSNLGSLRHLDLGKNHLLTLRLTGLSSQIERLDLSKNPNLVLEAGDLLAAIGKANIKLLELDGISGLRWTLEDDDSSICHLLRDRPYVEQLTLSGWQQMDGRLVKALDECSLAIDRLNLGSLATMQIDSRLGKWIAKRLEAGLELLDVSGNELGQQQIASILGNIATRANSIHLNHLNLSTNLLHRWPFESSQMVSKFSKLKSLDLSSNNIRHFVSMNTTPNCYSLGHLEILNLSSNFMQSIMADEQMHELGLGSSMQNLQIIDLSNNELELMPNLFFANLNQLRVLKLNKNKLRSLNLPKDRYLSISIDLSSNPIDTIGNFAGQNQVERFDSNHVDVEAFELVLYKNVQGVGCMPIDEYIELKSTTDQLSIDLGEESEECLSFSSWIDHIRLSQAVDVPIAENRLLHLSIRDYKSGQTFSRYTEERIIYLDLSGNELTHIRSLESRHLIRLMSLDLSHNKLSEMPWTSLSSCCSTLRYLDLGHNRITSLPKSLDQRLAEIYVIHLNNNQIKSLENLHKLIGLLPSIRFLDLRFNQIKYDSVIPKLEFRYPLLTVMPSDNQLDTIIYHEKPTLLINESLIQIERPSIHSNLSSLSLHRLKTMDQEFDQDPIYRSEDVTKPVRICTLDLAGLLAKLCLKFRSEEDAKCLIFKVPQNMTSCLTNLQIPSPIDVISLNDSRNGLNQQAIVSLSNSQRIQETNNNSSDPVISMIDSLKRNWIRARDFDLNKYLTSMIDVRDDSIWALIGGQYPIYTISLLKVAIVGGATCIVVLLIAMFSLLTNLKYHSGRAKVHCVEGNDKTIEGQSDTETGETSTITDNQSTTKRSSARSDPSPAYNASGCSTSKSSSSKETSDGVTVRQIVVPEMSAVYQLDAEQLLSRQRLAHHNQQNPAISLTPSSSLAPSSVETAETLQAIDSINSTTPSIMQQINGRQISSVDQYATDGLENVVAYDSTMTTRPHVATVMRMVKSNSTNFDTDNARRLANKQQQSQQLYGTLGTRYVHHNDEYATLRSKIRAVRENHRQQCAIYGSNTVQVPTVPTGSIADDDITLTRNGQNNEPFAVTPPPMLTDDHPELRYAMATSTMEQASVNDGQTSVYGHSRGNLCNFHRATSQIQPPQNVIFELEEDDQFPESSCDFDNINSILPPPPSSRAIEALENSQFAYHQGTLNNRRVG